MSVMSVLVLLMSAKAGDECDESDAVLRATMSACVCVSVACNNSSKACWSIAWVVSVLSDRVRHSGESQATHRRVYMRVTVLAFLTRSETQCSLFSKSEQSEKQAHWSPARFARGKIILGSVTTRSDTPPSDEPGGEGGVARDDIFACAVVVIIVIVVVVIVVVVIVIVIIVIV